MSSHFTSERTWTLQCPFAERPVKRTRLGKAEVNGDVTDATTTVQQPVDRETTADFVLDCTVGLAFLMQTAAERRGRHPHLPRQFFEVRPRGRKLMAQAAADTGRQTCIIPVVHQNVGGC